MLKIKAAITGSIFLHAALALIIYGNEPDPPPPPTKLTTGETAIISGIFNDAVNTGIVRKTQSPKYLKNSESINKAATVSNKTDIVFHGEKYHEADYSKAKSDFNFITFPHEATHIWQFQTDYKLTNGGCKIYSFIIFSPTVFESFCSEQQAEIIGTYAGRFLRYPAIASRHYFNEKLDNGAYTIGKDTPESDLALQKLVEGYFPQARITRLEFEVKNKDSDPIPFV